jgi:DedD protein
MAFFNFRKSSAEQPGSNTAADSLETLRQRARHRLIGAATLVIVGVVGFPLLFDSQPRPIAVDIAISIPDKAKAAPLTAIAASGVAVNALAAVPEPAAAVVNKIASPAAPDVPPVKTQPKVDEKAQARPEPKAEGKSPVKADDNAPQSNKAQALLDGKEPAAVAAAPRYTVQVGAFADAQKAHEARATLEKAGIKTYTQIVVTADGKRTRVRAGPWQDKAEAEKTAEKIKKLNLAAAVLTL